MEYCKMLSQSHGWWCFLPCVFLLVSTALAAIACLITSEERDKARKELRELQSKLLEEGQAEWVKLPSGAMYFSVKKTRRSLVRHRRIKRKKPL